MLIEVKVHTGSSREEIKAITKTKFEVWVHAQPIGNKANQSVIKLLAKHYKVAKSLIVFKSGTTSKIKKFVVEGTPQTRYPQA